MNLNDCSFNFSSYLMRVRKHCFLRVCPLNEIVRFILMLGLGLTIIVSATVRPVFSKPQAISNLLLHSKVLLDPTFSKGVQPAREKLLRDGNLKSRVVISANMGEPAELVYSFGGLTVTPRQLKIRTVGVASNIAKIEILVSTVSANAGFKSLRVEPISKSRNSWQNFSFEQSAAKWIMIKVIPFKKDVKVSIAELQLTGHAGSPVTVYKFDESPADALAVLSKLGESVDVSITDDEASLFADAADGKLDTWSFAEASLLSSGVLDKQRRLKYLKQIDDLEKRALKVLPKNGSSLKRGDVLLKWLHGSAFKKGYVKHQTDVSKVLDSGTYNCVSSSTLYNILGRRMGMDIRGIEVPDHAFSIMYDDTEHVDIETTTKHGFNPARNRAGLSEFQSKTGFVYIADKNRSKRREFLDAGMVAVTYYNHGVEFSRKKQYAKALASYFKALSLDPKNKSAVKNVLFVLNHWSLKLSKAGDYDRALKVISTGLGLAPKDRSLRHNNTYIWQKKARVAIDAGDTKGALDILKTAYSKTKNKTFQKMQVWVFSKQGEALIKQDNWQGARDLFRVALKSVDVSAQKDLKKWGSNLLLRWSNFEIKNKNFSKAVEVLESGAPDGKYGSSVARQLGYVTQEWSKEVERQDGEEAGLKIVTAMTKRFPKLYQVKRASRSFVIRSAQMALKKGNYEIAIASYGKAIKEFPKDSTLRRNQRAAWNQWAQVSMKKREWKAALDIFKQAHDLDPKASLFKKNITYVLQEWSKEVAAKDGIVAGEKLIAMNVDAFPKISGVKKLSGRLIYNNVLKSLKSGKFEDAEKKLLEGKSFFKSKSQYDGLAVNLYYKWSEPFVKSKDWEKAVKLYKRGYQHHVNNYKMKNNFIATWHRWAKSYMDKKQWQDAIGVYQRGLKDLPGTSLFKQNIAYSKQQMNK